MSNEINIGDSVLNNSTVTINVTKVMGEPKEVHAPLSPLPMIPADYLHSMPSMHPYPDLGPMPARSRPSKVLFYVMLIGMSLGGVFVYKMMPALVAVVEAIG